MESSNLVTKWPSSGCGNWRKHPQGVTLTIPPSGCEYTGHSFEVARPTSPSISFFIFLTSESCSSRFLLDAKFIN